MNFQISCEFVSYNSINKIMFSQFSKGDWTNSASHDKHILLLWEKKHNSLNILQIIVAWVFSNNLSQAYNTSVLRLSKSLSITGKPYALFCKQSDKNSTLWWQLTEEIFCNLNVIFRV